jgi:hypothetical protein
MLASSFSIGFNLVSWWSGSKVESWRRTRSRMNHFLCKSAFWGRNVLISMLLWLFSLITRTFVCMRHFRWTTRFFELIWLMILRFSQSFLWNVYKSCKIRKIFAFVWDFATSLIADWFQFFSSSFWFDFVSQSDRDIWSYERKNRIYLCLFVILRFSNVATSFSRVRYALFLSYYKSECRLCMLIRIRLNNRRIRHSYNVDTWLIRCIIQMTKLDIYKRRIWFWM